MEIKRKERAVEKIVKVYANQRVSADAIRQCLYSISDNNSFLNSNKKPVEDCIALLFEYFHPTNCEPGYSLSINETNAKSLGTINISIDVSHDVDIIRVYYT
jgi:Protein of unknown function (DUF2009)